MERDRNSKKTNNPVISIILGILVLLIIVSAIFLFHVLTMKKDLQSQFGEINAETKTIVQEKEEIQIYLPETCYAAVGVPMEIYNKQVTNQCADITKYNILWNCDIGENLERKYSLNPTEEMIGEYDLTLSVYDNALNLLAEKTCTLKVVDDNLKEAFEIYEMKDISAFSVDKIQGDAVSISLKADNVQEGKNNAESILTMIEEIRSAGINLPIYVSNSVYQETPDLAAFQLNQDLDEKLAEYEDVYIVPVGICVDMEHYEETADAQMRDALYAVLWGTANEI